MFFPTYMESNTFVYHRVEQSLFTPGIHIIKESKELSKYEQAETSKLLTRAQHFDDFFIRQQPANSGLRLNGILSVGAAVETRNAESSL